MKKPNEALRSKEDPLGLKSIKESWPQDCCGVAETEQRIPAGKL